MAPGESDGGSSIASSAKRRLRGDDFIGRALKFISEDPHDETLAELSPFIEYIENLFPSDKPFHEGEFIRLVIIRSQEFIKESRNEFQRYHRLDGISRFLVFVLGPRIEAQGDEDLQGRFESLQDRLQCLEAIDVEHGPANPRMSTVYDGLMELATLMGIVYPEEL